MQVEENVIAQYAKPEVKVELELDSGRKVGFRIIRWRPSKVFDRIPEYGSIFAVPMVMYGTAEELAGEDYEQKIAMSLIQLFSGLEQRVLSDLLKDILDETYTEDNVSVVEKFEELFMLHPYLVVDLAAKVLEVNYGPFFKRGFGKLLTQFQTVQTLNNS